jgi:aspartyl protease family protein
MSNKYKPEQIVEDVLQRISDGSIHREQRRVKIARVVAVVAVLLIVVIAIIDAPPSRAPDLTGVAEVRSAVQTDGAIHIKIPDNGDGQHVFRGRINDTPVTFVVDRGSSSVSIPLAVANHLKLPLGEAYQVKSATGAMRVYETVIDQLEIGGIMMNEVRAAILTEMHDDRIFLGMAFLRAFELRDKNGELTIIKAAP